VQKISLKVKSVLDLDKNGLETDLSLTKASRI